MCVDTTHYRVEAIDWTSKRVGGGVGGYLLIVKYGRNNFIAIKLLQLPRHLAETDDALPRKSIHTRLSIYGGMASKRM